MAASYHTMAHSMNVMLGQPSLYQVLKTCNMYQNSNELFAETTGMVNKIRRKETLNRFQCFCLGQERKFLT